MINKNIRHLNKLNAVLAVFFWILTIACVVMIFYFSHQHADESTETSSMIARMLVKIFGDSVTETVVRKGAHVFEFLILSILTFSAIYNTNKISVETSYSESSVKIIKSDNEMCIIFTTWFCILNAVVDEYHQLFVDGRDGSMKDVVIDSIGIVIVLIIIRIIFSIHLRFIGSKEVRYE